MSKVNQGMFPFFNGVKLLDGKDKYYFKLLKKVFEGRYKLEQVTKCYCGSDELEVLSIQDRFALPFGTKICKSCGLIQLSPRLSAECLSDFYNEIYWGLVLGEKSQELSTGDKYMAAEIYKYLEKHVILHFGEKELTVIEIGCGSGIKLNEIKNICSKNNIKVKAIGCDYSSDAVKMAKTKGVDCRLGGIDSLVGEKADIIILSHVIEHFINLKNELEDIKKLMTEKAYLYIEVPGVGDLVNKSEYGYNYLIYSVLAHMYNFNLVSLRSVLEPLGFEFVAGDEYIRSVFRFNPSHRTKLDVSGNYKQIILSLESAEEKRKSIELRNRLRLSHIVCQLAKKVLKVN